MSVIDVMTPEQLIYLTQITFAGVCVYSISRIAVAVIQNRGLHGLEVAISHNCGAGKKKPLVDRWLDRRKMKKEEKGFGDDPYIEYNRRSY